MLKQKYTERTGMGPDERQNRIMKMTIGKKLILGFVGLALAPGIAALANLSMLLVNIRRKIGLVDYKPLLFHLFKIAVAAIIGGAVSYLILDYFGSYSGYAGVFTTMYHLAMGVGAGLGVFGIIGFLLRIFRR